MVLAAALLLTFFCIQWLYTVSIVSTQFCNVKAVQEAANVIVILAFAGSAESQRK